MAITPDNRDHELDAVDFFVGFFKGLDNPDRLTHWDYSWDEDEKNKWAIKNKLYFDRRVVFDDYLYFLEIDNGTKDPEAIRRQMEGYVNLSMAFPQERFTVLFTTQTYRNYTAQKRLEIFLKIASSLKRGDQFLFALHAHTILPDGNPLLRVWNSPDPRHGGKLLALSDLD